MQPMMINTQYIDIHAHLLPGLDDGPPDWQTAIDLCRCLADDGITAAIATPHQLGRYDNQTRCADILAMTQQLNDRLSEHNIALTVYPGAEVRLDERIGRLLRQGRLLTLTDSGVYLLLELLPEVAVDLRPFIAGLIEQGITPVIAHVERYPYLLRRPQEAAALLAAGAVLQVTASSLVGIFGRSVQGLAWRLLSTGGAAVVASDAHNTAGRAPRMAQAYQQIARRLCPHAADRLCRDNPQRILDGRALKPLPNDSSLNTAVRFRR